jgi:hypothetical protein
MSAIVTHSRYTFSKVRSIDPRTMGWCKLEDKKSALKKSFSINQRIASGGVSVNFMQSLRNKINRKSDISFLRKSSTTPNYVVSLNHHRSWWKFGQSCRFLNMCFLLALASHVTCNGLIKSVSCDELLKNAEDRAHFTSTWVYDMQINTNFLNNNALSG